MSRAFSTRSRLRRARPAATCRRKHWKRSPPPAGRATCASCAKVSGRSPARRRRCHLAGAGQAGDGPDDADAILRRGTRRVHARLSHATAADHQGQRSQAARLAKRNRTTARRTTASRRMRISSGLAGDPRVAGHPGDHAAGCGVGASPCTPPRRGIRRFFLRRHRSSPGRRCCMSVPIASLRHRPRRPGWPATATPS